MNDDKTDWLERMVREAGWTGIYTECVSPTERKSMTIPVTQEQVVKFAKLVAAAEREACAKACEDLTAYQEDDPGESFAAAIRMRSNAIHTSEPKPNTDK